MRSPNLQRRQFTPQSDRTVIVNKIKEDCFNKFIQDNGTNVRENTYLSHIIIQEYSQFPSIPPPTDLPPNQIGSIKERILVLSSKYSGRVLLQKGKYNELKGIYQIGRVWDLDELKAITRAGIDGFILSLNKDYFWKSNEGVDRINRFIRHITKTYGSFVGKYPVLNGFSLSEFELSDQPLLKSFSLGNSSQEVINPVPDAQLLKTKSLKRKNLPNPIFANDPQSRKTSTSSFTFNPNSSQQTSSSVDLSKELYKDLDFTANGKLPVKPMKVIGKPAQSTFDKGSQLSLSQLSNTPITPNANGGQHEPDNESQSFIFVEEVQKSPTKHPYNVIRNSREVSGSLEQNASLSMALEKRLSKPDLKVDEDTESITEIPPPHRTKSKINFDAIDSSIQEIENFMDTQLNFGKDEDDNDISELETSFPITEPDAMGTPDVTTTIDLTKEIEEEHEKQEIVIEKDPEIEELLEEIQWQIYDSSDELIKKMTRELNKLKYNNVKQLINVDFSGNSMKNDLVSSLNEVENLNHIFKRMELDLKNLGDEINLIENNSQGLQLRSINKKILYNDLKLILDKIGLNHQDLSFLEGFKDFESLNQLKTVESQSLNLLNALETINSDGSTHLIEINSLKQYQENYQYVANKLIKHFLSFFKRKFTDDFKSELIYPHSLVDSLKNLMVYSSLTYFIKEISVNDFNDMKFFVNNFLSDIIERLLKNRIKKMNFLSHYPSEKNVTKLTGKEQDDSGINKLEDIKPIVDLISDTKDISLILTTFLGELFHFDTNIYTYQDYLKFNPLEKRLNNNFDEPGNYSNEVISNLNTIFGNYVNLFTKITPIEHNIPIILNSLRNQSSQVKTQDFFQIFVKKISDKYENVWNKFIKTMINDINTSSINTKNGIIPSIKNVEQFFYFTETVLKSNRQEIDEQLVSNSYKEIVESCIHLFIKDDPLLKNNEFDDKERNHRNINLLQNIFCLLQQVSSFNNERTNKIRLNLESVFKKIEDNYFKKLLNQNLGKLVEFVNTYDSITDNIRAKKYTKKSIKALVSNYSNKDLGVRIGEIKRKLNKHFLSGNNMLEKDLLERLWLDMEKQIVMLFGRLDKIVVNYEIEYHVSKQEIHTIFRSLS